MPTQKQKQSQKVVVNINAPKRKRRAKKTRARKTRVVNPNSIGYALNNQLYQISQPKFMDYNFGLAQSNMLREQQMRTGSLIPNQQINSLTPIVATAVAQPLGNNPFSVQSTNNQFNMLDPTEGLVEEVVEAETTDTYNPVVNRMVNKLENLASAAVADDLMIRELKADLSGARSKMDSYALGERGAAAIGPSLFTPPRELENLKEKAMSESVNMLDNRKQSAGELDAFVENKSKKSRTPKYFAGEFEIVDELPEERKVARGRPLGSKNKPKSLGKDIVVPTTPFKF